LVRSAVRALSEHAPLVLLKPAAAGPFSNLIAAPL
jgi:hypothetical protein